MFNVLTANSTNEGKELLERMPVDGIVVHERAFRDRYPSAAISELKQVRPNTPVVLLSPNPSGLDGADRVLSSHDPIELVRVLQEMFNLRPDPALLESAPQRRR
ncbi:MAG: hypothetical protein ACXVZX_16555 [Terriglobales bacterium]